MAKGKGKKNTVILDLMKKQNQHEGQAHDSFLQAADRCNLAELAAKIQSIPQDVLRPADKNLIEEAVIHLKSRKVWKGKDFDSAIAIIKILFNNKTYCSENILNKHGFTCLLLQVFFSQLRGITLYIHDDRLHSVIGGYKDPRIQETIPGWRRGMGLNKNHFEIKYKSLFDPVIQLLKEFQQTSYQINGEQLKNFTLSIHEQIIDCKQKLWNALSDTHQTSANKKIINFLDQKWEELFVVLQKWTGPLTVLALKNTAEPALLLQDEAEKLMESFSWENSRYQNADFVLRSICRRFRTEQPIPVTVVNIIFKKLAEENCSLVLVEKSADLLQNLAAGLQHLENMAGMLGVTEYEITLAQLMAELNPRNKDLEPHLFNINHVKPLSPNMQNIWLMYGAPVSVFIESLKENLSQFAAFINDVYGTDLRTKNYDKRALVELCYHTTFVIVENVIKPHLATAITNNDEISISRLIKLFNQTCRVALNFQWTLLEKFYVHLREALEILSGFMEGGPTLDLIAWEARFLSAMNFLTDQEQEVLLCDDKEPIREWALTSLNNLRNLLLFNERTVDLLSKFHPQNLAQPSIVGFYGSSHKQETKEIISSNKSMERTI